MIPANAPAPNTFYTISYKYNERHYQSVYENLPDKCCSDDIAGLDN